LVYGLFLGRKLLAQAVMTLPRSCPKSTGSKAQALSPLFKRVHALRWAGIPAAQIDLDRQEKWRQKYGDAKQWGAF